MNPRTKRRKRVRSIPRRRMMWEKNEGAVVKEYTAKTKEAKAQEEEEAEVEKTKGQWRRRPSYQEEEEEEYVNTQEKSKTCEMR